MKISLPEETVSKTETKTQIEIEVQITENGNMTSNLDESNFPHYKRVSDYLLGTCIGEGSFAKVREGFHCPTKEKVAIKIINKAKARRDSYVYKNLHREGRLLQMLRHPNIVQVFDILETGNNYYLVTELCNGGELIDIVTDEGSLSEKTVCNYMKQLTDAVTYMQDRKIVHRDLKVENLLLDSEGNLKIIDFGLSNILPERSIDLSSSLITQCGSPAYAAPELLAKKSYGPKVDIWSIGIITYALLVGKLPFTVDPFSIPKLCKKMMRGEMNPIPSNVSSACRSFIRKLLTPDHSQRPSIHEVGKLKWLSMFSATTGLGVTKNSMSGMFIDTLNREGNIRNRSNYLTPLLYPLIDSSVVKDMSSSFGFASSEVIQSVQKNRPGPALATYHLLSKKKSWRKSRTPSETFVKSAQMDDKTAAPKPDDTSSTSSDDNESSNNLRKNVHQNQGEKSLDSGPSPTTVEKTDTKEIGKALNANVAKLLITETTKENSKPSIPMKPKLASIPVSKTLSFDDKLPINNTTELIQEPELKTVEPRKIAIAEKNRQRQPSIGSKPLVSINAKSPANDVSDMLANMRKARQVLEKKQRVNQQQKQLDLSNFNKPIHPKPPTNVSSEETTLEEEKSLPTTLIKQSKTAHKVWHRLLTEQRSASQQGPRPQTEIPNCELSPHKRPSSHNSVLQEKSENATVNSRLVNTLSSPLKMRFSADYTHPTRKSNPEAKDSKPPTNRTNSITLPKIAPKPTDQFDKSPYAAHLTSPNSKTRTMRQSFPTPNSHFSRNHRFTLHSTNETHADPFRKQGKHHDEKNATMPRWRKPPQKDTNHGYKPNYNYIVTANPHSTVRQRPKKVISEPIAATISYLTSIKQKTFNKEKAPSITTG